MKLGQMLIALRQNLLDALAENNRSKLYDLKITFSLLVEVAYSSQDERLISLLVALEDAARDGGMGVSWKSDIPSIEAIQAATAEPAA
jgi:hypothetical protein